jgi:FtsP/CotA-like multicopper oxidase with cupredoxin domain
MASWREKLALAAQRNRREIIKARLSRREMMRMGLLTAGGSLVVKQGLSARWALADDGSLTFVKGIDGPPSPPSIPWNQELPRLPILPDVPANKLTGGHRDPITGAPPPFMPPNGTTLVDGATHRVPLQLFGLFPPKKFYELFMKEGAVRLNGPNPNFGSTTIWGFSATLDGPPSAPGPLIHATYGEPVLVRFQNSLPSVNIPAPGGFGIAEITTHLHNGHTPTESDGNPVDFFNSSFDAGPQQLDPATGQPILVDGKPVRSNPFGFKDQFYPNVYAGYTNTKTNPNPVVPAASNSIATPAGDKTEALSSLWYHDHHLDFTAQNVYKGMFGPYNLFDARDNGNENNANPHDLNAGLGLPSGPFDIPIFFNDFVLDQDFQLVFDLFDLDGILGDTFCANGAIKPFMSVFARRYRLRLYNPGPSRWYQFALFNGTDFVPFYQVATDGNLLPQAVPVTSVRLSVAERADIVVDFSKTSAKRLYLVNILEQVNGRGPTGNLLNPGTALIQINISPLPQGTRDPSTDFADPKNQGLTLRNLPDPDFNALLARAAKAKTRTFRFERGNGAWQVNGALFDPDVISADPTQEAEEVWVIQNPGGGWRHPVHIHFEEHRPLTRDGVPIPQIPSANPQANGTIDYARRDVVPLNDNNEVRIFFRFRDLHDAPGNPISTGRYVMHCHNVVHEDHAMMIRLDIEPPIA